MVGIQHASDPVPEGMTDDIHGAGIEVQYDARDVVSQVVQAYVVGTASAVAGAPGIDADRPVSRLRQLCGQAVHVFDAERAARQQDDDVAALPRTKYSICASTRSNLSRMRSPTGCSGGAEQPTDRADRAKATNSARIDA